MSECYVFFQLGWNLLVSWGWTVEMVTRRTLAKIIWKQWARVSQSLIQFIFSGWFELDNLNDFNSRSRPFVSEHLISFSSFSLKLLDSEIDQEKLQRFRVYTTFELMRSIHSKWMWCKMELIHCCTWVVYITFWDLIKAAGRVSN